MKLAMQEQVGEAQVREEVQKEGVVTAIRPRNASENELDKVGVEIRDESHFILGCKICGHGWSPMLPSGGRRLHRGYWKCPNCYPWDYRRIKW